MAPASRFSTQTGPSPSGEGPQNRRLRRPLELLPLEEEIDGMLVRFDVAVARLDGAQGLPLLAEANLRRVCLDEAPQKDRPNQFMLNHRYTSDEQWRRYSRHGSNARRRRGGDATAYGRFGSGRSLEAESKRSRDPHLRSLPRRRG